MAYEIISNAKVTPHRLYALLRLIPRLDEPKRKDLLKLLQPVEFGVKDHEDAGQTLLAARHCGLANYNENLRSQPISLQISPTEIETLEAYRACMRRNLFGVTEDNYPNYLFNLFSAWYAVQNETVLQDFSNSDKYAIKFNEDLFPGLAERRLDGDKYDAWRDWAAFLGLGWLLRTGRRVYFVPDAYYRLEALLPTLLPTTQAVSFGEFVRRMSEHCPELDGGKLFEFCYTASNKGKQRNNNLSLMLSNALRGLHDDQKIMLERRPDAQETWFLYPAQGQILKEITHIRLGVTNG